MGAWSSTPSTSIQVETSRLPAEIPDPCSRSSERKRKRMESGHTTAPASRRRLETSPVTSPAENVPLHGNCVNSQRARILEAPVHKTYLLRTLRDEDGSLRLDTTGAPLYSAGFLERIPSSALVTQSTRDIASNGAIDATNESVKNGFGQEADSNGSKHESSTAGQGRGRFAGDQSNFLDFSTRKALRKKQVAFPRSVEVTKTLNTVGTDEVGVPRLGAFGERDIKRLDLKDKLLLAPLTTNGNLPYRRVCKKLGIDITCGEMALAQNLLQGQNSEWALMRRHRDEDVFGVQLAGSNPEMLSRAAEIVARTCDIDFIDLNAGCPIDLIYQRGAGCALMGRGSKFCRTVASMSHVMDVPLSVKMRMGIDLESRNAHDLITKVARSGAAWITVHGRTRKQRYSRVADWDYVSGPCAQAAQEAGIPLVGNGDTYNWNDAAQFFQGGERANAGIDSVMLARGALIKPWLATEIKERRDWDISSTERLDIYKDFCKYGLDHWGGDKRGVENTRRFLLEWLSFTYRYVPLGILEANSGPVTMTHRSPYFRGRNDLETLMGSHASADWIRISEMLLGPVPPGFSFQARHKSNAWGAEGAMNG